MKAVEKIADIIQAETKKGGYLHEWSDVAPLMTQEQQRGYFQTLGRIILRELKKLGQ